MANLKSVAKITETKTSAKDRALSMAGSLAIKSARKAAKRGMVKTGKLGRPMFLQTASLYTKVKNEGQPNEYEKTMLRGFDAVNQVQVAGIEYHGPEFKGELTETVFSNSYTTSWKAPDGNVLTYEHVCGPMPGTSSEEFWELVLDAQASEEAKANGTNQDTPEIAV